VLGACYALLGAATVFFVLNVRWVREHPRPAPAPEGGVRATRRWEPRAVGGPVYSDKATAAYVIEHARDGDVLVFTRLSRAAIDYYLRRSPSPKTFTRISFPGEVERHPGWMDRAKLLARPEALEAEAVSALERLRQRLHDGRSDAVWVFCKRNEAIGEILTARLDADLALRETLDLRGSQYNQVLVYTQRTRRGGRPTTRRGS
jgi:hypothetical protein